MVSTVQQSVAWTNLGRLALIIALIVLPELFLPDKLVPEAAAQESRSKLNREIQSTNIAFLWTERGKLKVITVMAINHHAKKAGIANIPLSAYSPGEGKRITIAEIYQKEGKTGLLARLERYLGVPLQHRVEVEQQVLKRMSDILGTFEVNGDTLNMAQAFELTSTGERQDDQDVVRVIAGTLIQSKSWVKIPQLVWIMAGEVQTDLGAPDIWCLFREFCGIDANELRKEALPGQDYLEAGKKYRKVPVENWGRILAQVTGQN